MRARVGSAGPGSSRRALGLGLMLAACGEDAPPGGTSGAASSLAASVPTASASVDAASAAVPSVATAAGPCVARGAAYAAQAGNAIVLCDAIGTERVVVERAPDAEPSLSPSGRSIAFVRKLGQETVHDAGMKVSVEDNRVVVVDVVTREEREVAKNGRCLALHRPVFLDDAFLMFTSRGYGGATARHTSVCGRDLATPDASMVSLASGASCATAIAHGRYLGHVYVTGVSGTPPSEYTRIVDRTGGTRAEHALDRVPVGPDGLADRQTGDHCNPDLRLDVQK